MQFTKSGRDSTIEAHIVIDGVDAIITEIATVNDRAQGILKLLMNTPPRLEHA